MNARKTKVLLGVLVGLFVLSTATLLVVIYLVNRATGPATTVPTFAELRESDIAGRYKMTDGGKEMFIVLYGDHTFMNEDGTVYPQYRWDIALDSFSLTWQRNTTVFTNIEAHSVFTGTKENGRPLRLEKLPPYTSAELAPGTPVASIRFGASCETNGLVPVHQVGVTDGELLPGNVQGADCYRLVRKQGSRDAYLHLQIAPECKDPPFTNALVVVEFFDRPAAGGYTGRLLIHYDDERGGPYLAAQPLPLAGSDTWQEATFFLPTPLFQNRQDSGADLRLAVNRSELPIRSVKLLKNVPLPETKMPVLTRR